MQHLDIYCGINVQMLKISLYRNDKESFKTFLDLGGELDHQHSLINYS